MTLDGLDSFELFKTFYFPDELYFPASILRAIHSIDICTVKIKRIRYMHAVFTNQITHIWHFNDKVVIARCLVQYGKYFPIFSYFATYLHEPLGE